MKTHYKLIIITFGVMFCFACTKSTLVHPTPGKLKSTVLDTAFTTTPASASIIGKWRITKQRVQTLTATTGAIIDTTFTASAFNDTDIYQFNSDSTAAFASGTIFFPSSFVLVNGSTQAVTPIIFLYKVSGPGITIAYKYHISMPLNANPGPYPESIVKLDATTLVLHGTNTTPNGSEKTVLDTWLSRE